MSLNTTELMKQPLFQGLNKSALEKLASLFKEKTLSAGQTLFHAGDHASDFYLLTEGEVSLVGESGHELRVRPATLIGELGAMTHLPRNASCKALKTSCVWLVSREQLLDFFTKNPDISYVFYRNLLHAVAIKLNRDTSKLEQVKTNLIRTQKSMKELRDYVLESPETVVSKKVCDVLSEHIEKNRRAGYRVKPTPKFNAIFQMQEESFQVLEISNGHLTLQAGKHAFSPQTELIGALLLPEAQIPVSGSVTESDASQCLVKLDPLLEDANQKLESYTMQLQMLDFVA